MLSTTELPPLLTSANYSSGTSLGAFSKLVFVTSCYDPNLVLLQLNERGTVTAYPNRFLIVSKATISFVMKPLAEVLAGAIPPFVVVAADCPVSRVISPLVTFTSHWNAFMGMSGDLGPSVTFQLLNVLEAFGME